MGRVALDYDFGLDPRFRIATVRREGTIWDTRLANPSLGSSDRLVLMIILEGTLEWHGAEGFVVESASAFAASVSSVEGENGRRLRTFRSQGSPFLALELQVERGLMRAASEPSLLPISARVLEAARAHAARVNASAPVKREVREQSVRAFLDALHDDEILTADLSRGLDVDEPTAGLLWRVLRPLCERIELLPSLDSMANLTGFTLRQFGRRFDGLLDRFHLPWDGWRELTRGYRLKVAVLLLSNHELAPGDVARRCGYSSVEALTHALTTEGLPAATDLRRRILANTG